MREARNVDSLSLNFLTEPLSSPPPPPPPPQTREQGIDLTLTPPQPPPLLAPVLLLLLLHSRSLGFRELLGRLLKSDKCGGKRDRDDEGIVGNLHKKPRFCIFYSVGDVLVILGLDDGGGG